jgi:hypothetical protein
MNFRQKYYIVSRINEIRVIGSMNYNNIPKKKRRKKKYRLKSMGEWISNYVGSNIVEGYAKWYDVDLACALSELRLNGQEISEDYEGKIQKLITEKKATQALKKRYRAYKKEETEEHFSDDTFAFIAGYTSGGAAYGITHEEMDSLRYFEEE